MQVGRGSARGGRGLRRGLLAGVSVLAAAVGAGEAAAFSYKGQTWVVDRFVPVSANVNTTFQSRTDVLQVTVGTAGFSSNRGGGFTSQFYSTQGYKTAITQQSGRYFLQADLWIPSAWNVVGTAVADPLQNNNCTGNFVQAGLWASQAVAGPSINGFPIMAFRNANSAGGCNGVAPGIWIWNVELGGWSAASGTPNYNAWNTFRVEYRGNTLVYKLNGVQVGTSTLAPGQTLTGDPTNRLNEIFFNTVNDNATASRQINWSGLDWGLLFPSAGGTLTANHTASVEVESGGVFSTNGFNIAGNVEVFSGGVLNGTAGNSITGNLDNFAGGTVQGGTVASRFQVAGGVNNSGILSGNLRITGTLTNSGVIRPGTSPGIISVVGNYAAGPGATLDAEVDFALAPVAGVTHDLFEVTGNVTGVTALNVIDISTGPAIATTGNGILLARVGGTAASNAFTLAAPVAAGGFQYGLAYVANFSGSDDGFFLQSGARSELVANAALLGAGQAMTRRCFDGAHRNLAFSWAEGEKRLWATGGIGTMEAGAASGVPFDLSYDCAHGGSDLLAGEGVRVGLGAGYGDAQADLPTLSGLGRLYGDMRMVELYATYAAGRFFANAAAGYGATDWRYTPGVGAGRSADADGLLLSAAAGYGFDLGQDFGLIVTGAVSHDGMACGDSCLVAGAREDAGVWAGKAAMRLQGAIMDGAVKPYTELTYTDELSEGTSAALGTVSATSTAGQAQMGVAAGLTADIAPGAQFYLNAGLVDSAEDAQGYNGSFGLMFAW